MERQGIEIVIRRVSEMNVLILLLVVGGAAFLLLFNEVAQQSRDHNRCVSISKKALTAKGWAEPRSHAVAVSECNGNSHFLNNP
jgi:hypothetical protein